MKKLRTTKTPAELRAQAKMKDQLQDITRWSFSFNMLQRCAEIRQYLSDLEDKLIQKIKLRKVQDEKLDDLLLQT